MIGLGPCEEPYGPNSALSRPYLSFQRSWADRIRKEKQASESQAASTAQQSTPLGLGLGGCLGTGEWQGSGGIRCTARAQQQREQQRRLRPTSAPPGGRTAASRIARPPSALNSSAHLPLDAVGFAAMPSGSGSSPPAPRMDVCADVAGNQPSSAASATCVGAVSDTSSTRARRPASAPVRRSTSAAGSEEATPVRSRPRAAAAVCRAPSPSSSVGATCGLTAAAPLRSGSTPKPTTARPVARKSPARERSAFERNRSTRARTANRRLADPRSFTGVYRRRHESGGFGRMHAEGGDFCSGGTIRAEKLLRNRSYGELTIPKRAMDFRAETEWRLSLRPTCAD